MQALFNDLKHFIKTTTMITVADKNVAVYTYEFQHMCLAIYSIYQATRVSS